MPRNSTILLIEEHPIMAEMIRHLIALRKPLFKVLSSENTEDALAILKREPVHLVISGLHFSPSQENYAFLAVLNGWNPPIPIIVISETRVNEMPLMAGGITVLQKPIEVEVLIELIDTMTSAAQESVLNGVTLENFLQMLEQESKTCTLRIISGYQVGHMYLKDGRLIGSKTGTLHQKAAALAILAWPNCTINISEGCQIEPTMNHAIHSLLVEWCIYKDETKAPKTALAG